MKTEISNHGFRPERQYSGVYQQQRRMITDRDWNELTDILKARLDTALQRSLADGAPRLDGLLAMTENSDGSITSKLHENGWVVADGIFAQLRSADPKNPFGYLNQADFRNPPALLSPHFLYVDVWDRTVVSLEDPELLDPGLHGADTCFRSRTMAQLKICAAPASSQKPECCDEALNPRIGNAGLGIKLRQDTVSPDPCDPCAGKVELESSVGNYLFRLEVHDVVMDKAQRTLNRLVLKWSSENAAEQHLIDRDTAIPPGFNIGDYVYEYYNDDTERALGVHLVNAADVPPRGKLQKDFSVTPPAADHTYVRRWDGYCVLTRNNDGSWGLDGADPGVDRGITLTTSGAVEDHGHVAIGSHVTLNLHALSLDLFSLDSDDKSAAVLDTSQFVSGDFWLALVRDRASDPANKIHVLSDQPIGIHHHYLPLGLVDTDGQSISELSDADIRRLGFPPLTDIRARDVSYNPANCPQAAEANISDVQKALDVLCHQPVPHGPYLALRYVGGDGQEGISGKPLPCPLIVGVENEKGCKVPDVPVVFAALSEGDTLEKVTLEEVGEEVGNPANHGQKILVHTNKDGYAAVHWTLSSAEVHCHRVNANLPAHRGLPDIGSALGIQFHAVARPKPIEYHGPQIEKISWNNDRTMGFGQFIEEGLTVTFSERMNAATASLNTFIVTLELVATDPVFAVLPGGPALILNGKIVVKEDRKVWVFQPSPEALWKSVNEWLGAWIFHLYPDVFRKYMQQWLEVEHHLLDIIHTRCVTRCRVVLKGNAILDEEGRRPLDGNVFCKLGHEINPLTERPVTELILPSGDGRRGGDFESWFFIINEPEPR